MAQVTLTVAQPNPTDDGPITFNAFIQIGDTNPCTNASPSSTVCTVALAEFISGDDGAVRVSDIVKNITTGEQALVVSVDSDIKITTTTIVDDYTDTDSIEIWRGGLPVTPTSYKIMAYFRGSTTLPDNYGVDRETVAAWNNIIPTLNDTITIPVSFTSTREFTFVVISQSAAEYIEENVGTRLNQNVVHIEQLTATTWDITISHNTVSDGNLTIGEDPNILEYSPPTKTSVSFRPPNERAYDGSGISVSYVDDRIIDTVTITGNNTVSDDDTTMQTIQRWMRDRVYIQVEDDATSYFNWIKGFINNFSEYNSRITTVDFNILILVDEEDVG